MMKWLQKFKLKNKKNVHSKNGYSKIKCLGKSLTRSSLRSVARSSHFCLQIRVDDKGLVYHPATTNLYLELDPQGYTQVCQTMGYVALMEMREKDRIVH